MRFDDKCMVKLPLPKYPIATLRVGRLGGLARQPTAQGDFDVYLDDSDGRTLTYIREPCAATEAEAPFFLHVTPVRVRDLPARRRRAGFERHHAVFRVAVPAIDVEQNRCGAL